MSYEEEKTGVLHAGEGHESPEGGESFASLLEKSQDFSLKLTPGQKVTTRIISISNDTVYVDLGGKSDGTIDLNEFIQQDGSLSVKEGDRIEAFFLSVQDGMRKLTTMKRGYSAVKLTSIRNAYEANVPVSGIIKREIKGGFEVSVGEVRCFCPFSQIDLKGGREGGNYLGQTFDFKVVECKEEGRNVNIVLSRRSLLEAEKERKIAGLRETLSVGMDVNATVSSIMNFGVFVDLGGIDGLIPVSEISWGRIDKPADTFTIGQQVAARIISLDWEKRKISLSIKATQPDPWTGITERYPVDGRISGTIVRLTPFGAFMNLEPGIDGLIHISNLGAGRRINHPKEVVEVGQLAEAYVLSVDPAGRKISLSLKPKPKVEKIALPAVGELLEGVVEKIMPYGIFVKMANGLTGLIPNAEMGTNPGADHKKTFPAGTEIKAAVIEVDTAKRKIRLSRKALMEKEVKEEYQQYTDSTQTGQSGSGGLGSLGDILRAKLEEKNGKVA